MGLYSCKALPSKRIQLYVIRISFLGINSKQTFNQIAQYSLHLVTLISFLLGMSDNIPSLDQIDFFSSLIAFMLLLLSVMTTAIQPFRFCSNIYRF
jgi:hypothetical protein